MAQCSSLFASITVSAVLAPKCVFECQDNICSHDALNVLYPQSWHPSVRFTRALQAQLGALLIHRCVLFDLLGLLA